MRITIFTIALLSIKGIAPEASPISGDHQTTKDKRCATHDILVESTNPILSISRREANADRRKQQCEQCLNTRMCQERNLCNGCRLFCDPPREDNTVGVPETVTDAFGVKKFEHRAGEGVFYTPEYRFYTVGSIGPSNNFNTIAELLKIAHKDEFAKFIVVGKIATHADNVDNSGYMLIDGNQEFSNDTIPKVYRLNDQRGDREAVVERDIRHEIEKARTKSGREKLQPFMINSIVDVYLKAKQRQDFLNVNEPSTRCNEAEEDRVELLPSTSSRIKEEPQNPTVIQDNFGVVGEPEENEAKKQLIGEELQALHVADEERANPQSESQFSIGQSEQPKDQPIRNSNTIEHDLLAEEIPQRTLQIDEPIDDNGEITATNGLKFPQMVPEERPKSLDNAVKPTIVGSKLEDAVVNLVKESLKEPIIGESNSPQEATVESRNQFPPENHFHKFGTLVPATGGRPIDDPNSKRVFFVGRDINLPLKMFEDQSGALQLSVDMDKLCNCKKKDCTKHHVSHELVEGPPFFQDERREPSELVLKELMDPLELKSEGGVFKRSTDLGNEKFDEVASIGKEFQFGDDEDKLALELQMLSEDVKKYRKKNENLLNRGTVALVKNVDNSRKAEKVTDLASDLLLWMKKMANQ